jgi:hypothetical protein
MYTSPFWFVLMQILQMLHPLVLIIIILAALAGMGGRSVSGQVGHSLAGVAGALLSGVLSLVQSYFDWSKRFGSRMAGRMLNGTNAGRSEHSLFRWVCTALIWTATYFMVFYPWLPTAALTPSPSFRSAPANTPEQIAMSWVDTLHSAQRRGSGGVEVNGRRYPPAQIERAIDLINDPAQAAVAGLPTDLQASKSNRLRGFVLVTPQGGANGRPIQDFP